MVGLYRVLRQSPTGGARTRVVMVESTGRNSASPSAPAPSKEASEELELFGGDGDSKVCAKQGLLHETTWGPFRGKIQVEAPAVELAGGEPRITLVTDDRDCWLTRLSLTSDGTAANSIIYSKGDELYCKTSQVIPEGESVTAILVSGQREGSSPLKTESTYPAALHPDIQLLPQQAGMAAILATAVVNSSSDWLSFIAKLPIGLRASCRVSPPPWELTTRSKTLFLFCSLGREGFQSDLAA
ncbi:UNVERIFIED_CONTAM: hypothetical protein FKN15_043608 [Acipenser sinensis]